MKQKEVSGMMVWTVFMLRCICFHTQEKNLDCLSGWVREVLARVFGEKKLLLKSNHVMHNTIVGELRIYENEH